MIEVDVFWSFAIGASIACAAGPSLQYNSNPLASSYFAYLCFVLACVFAPSGCYLLIAYPGWESMFLLNREYVNSYPILITIFSSTNTLLGMIGYYEAWWVMRYTPNGLIRAQKYWVIPYVIMFAILGLGYNRFLYSSSYENFHENKKVDWMEFFTQPSDVFVTLLKMGLILIPLLYYPVFAWGSSHINGKVLKEALRWYGIGIIIVSCGYIGFIHYFTEFQITFADDRYPF
ncbi:hypothetical protein RFI_04605 [Reticulomyxa filosa]|uniref:Uncharacterized protein n=1 Tax=Reticulomyxa filosa TaxID=46433 RepID=X6P304_RETFI|nr:hypothetical protein RFI_04605 [Reticulomyxa filosa]|eukprot:ETO32513.1 hypothetical protein RFI_04605 [Reticulomyxa filosa]